MKTSTSAQAKQATETIISKIKATRLEKGYSQEYVAKKLGITQNAYSKIEIGQTELTVQRLFALEEILEGPASVFLTQKKRSI